MKLPCEAQRSIHIQSLETECASKLAGMTKRNILQIVAIEQLYRIDWGVVWGFSRMPSRLLS